MRASSPVQMEAIADCNNGQALFVAWRNKKPSPEAGDMVCRRADGSGESLLIQRSGAVTHLLPTVGAIWKASGPYIIYQKPTGRMPSQNARCSILIQSQVRSMGMPQKPMRALINL